MSLPDFQKIQYEFANYIRNPASNPKPEGIEQRRLNVYTELFYNNVEGFLSGAFPVLKEIFTDFRWNEIVRDFFSRHQSHSPYFLQISEEFLAYLQSEFQPEESDPAFMLELAHYEWMELALDVSEHEVCFDGIQENGDLFVGRPVLSPLVQALVYAYPVHQINSDFQPQDPPEQPTCILVYRDRHFNVGFMLSNPVTHRLVELLGAEPSPTGEQALNQIAQEMQHPDPQVVIDGGLKTLHELLERDILLGTML